MINCIILGLFLTLACTGSSLQSLVKGLQTRIGRLLYLRTKHTSPPSDILNALRYERARLYSQLCHMYNLLSKSLNQILALYACALMRANNLGRASAHSRLKLECGDMLKRHDFDIARSPSISAIRNHAMMSSKSSLGSMVHNNGRMNHGGITASTCSAQFDRHSNAASYSPTKPFSSSSTNSTRSSNEPMIKQQPKKGGYLQKPLQNLQLKP